MKRKREIALPVCGLALVFALAGCGNAKGESVPPQPQPEVSEEPLVVETEILDYDAEDIKQAEAVKEGEGYELQESLNKSELSGDEWDKALEPFTDQLSLRYEDSAFTFEGRDDSMYIQGMFRDREGYTYVVADKRILMIDSDGNVAAQQDYGRMEDEMSGFVGDPVISDTGEIVFPIVDYGMSTVKIVSFDRKSGKERVLGQMEDQMFQNTLCALRGDRLFYRSGDWIIDWNLSSGERTRFFDLKKAGADDCDVVMGFSEEGVPELYIGGEMSMFRFTQQAGGEEFVAVLGVSQPQTGLTIRISDLVGDMDNGFVASATGMYRVKHRDISVEYHTEADREAYRTKVMAEIASGREADILCVTRSDFYTLWEKGVIADMEELISQDTRDALLPAALELGQIDGKLAGIVPTGYALALAASRQDWDRDSWSMEEFMAQTRKLDKKFAWIEVSGDGLDLGKPGLLLTFAGVPNLEDMGLIDFQNGKADLDSEAYMDLLRFCKEYGMGKQPEREEYDAYRADRVSMAKIAGFLYDFSYYERFFTEWYEEGDCNMVGFPAENAGSNYLNSSKWIVVSKRALEDPEKKEAISDYLEYLLSEDGQRNIKYYLSVRKPTAETCYEIGEAEDYNGILIDGYPIRDIVCMGRKTHARQKKDGSTCLPEFMEFLENCTAEPYIPLDVSEIIHQEADLFFEGKQSVEETARATQNRVQLCLDEGT